MTAPSRLARSAKIKPNLHPDRCRGALPASDSEEGRAGLPVADPLIGLAITWSSSDHLGQLARYPRDRTRPETERTTTNGGATCTTPRFDLTQSAVSRF